MSTYTLAPAPFGIPNRITIYAGVCSDGALTENGFALGYAISSLGTLFGSIPLNNGAYVLAPVPCWWSGKSWSGLVTTGQRAVTDFSLFPDLQISRIAIGICMWYDGQNFVCGINVGAYEYEALTAQCGMMFPSLDPTQIPKPKSGFSYVGNPPNYPYLNGGLLAEPSGFQVPDYGSPNVQAVIAPLSVGCPHPKPVRTAKWNEKVIGGYSHTGYDQSQDQFTDQYGDFNPYGAVQSALPSWVRPRLYYANEFDPVDRWFCVFGSFSVGNIGNLNLFWLGANTPA